MRTILIMVAGCVLLGLCLLLARAAGRSTAAAVAAFLPLWLVAAAANMWIGVNRAGYSFGEELPIFLLIFAVPAAVAILAQRLLRG